MWQSARVGVVIPAWREEALIGRTLGRIPPWIDRILVIDDASPDATAERAVACGDPRLTLLRHPDNRGVGAAIATGYAKAMQEGWDVAVVMAADDQMDPVDLPELVAAVVSGGADYAKGNRLAHPQARSMPWPRRVAGRMLAHWTNLWTGLRIDDSQCGFTALSRSALQQLPLQELWPRYGYPNDLLVMLASRKLKVVQCPVRPVYADEVSGVRFWHAAVVAAVVVRRAWLERLRPSAEP
jgi:dolichol-phosphate mannosyltransferase